MQPENTTIRSSSSWRSDPAPGFYRRYLLAIICIAGGYLVLFMMDALPGHVPEGWTPCIFKNITGIPCPGCGMGRATLALVHGDLTASLYDNLLCIPFSIAVCSILIWMTADLIRHRETIYPILMRRTSMPVTIVLVIAIGITWILNIIHHM